MAELEFFPKVGDAYTVPLRVSVSHGSESRVTLAQHLGTGTTADGRKLNFAAGFGGTLEVRFEKGPTFEVNVRDLITAALKAMEDGALPPNAVTG